MTASEAWQAATRHLDLATSNLILLGLILSLSILADTVASRTRLPRISLLVLVGVGVAIVQQGWLGQEGGASVGGARRAADPGRLGDGRFPVGGRTDP